MLAYYFLFFNATLDFPIFTQKLRETSLRSTWLALINGSESCHLICMSSLKDSDLLLVIKVLSLQLCGMVKPFKGCFGSMVFALLLLPCDLIPQALLLGLENIDLLSVEFNVFYLSCNYNFSHFT